MVSGSQPKMQVIPQIPIIMKVLSQYLQTGKSFFLPLVTGRKELENATFTILKKKVINGQYLLIWDSLLIPQVMKSNPQFLLMGGCFILSVTGGAEEGGMMFGLAGGMMTVHGRKLSMQVPASILRGMNNDPS